MKQDVNTKDIIKNGNRIIDLSGQVEEPKKDIIDEIDELFINIGIKTLPTTKKGRLKLLRTLVINSKTGIYDLENKYKENNNMSSNEYIFKVDELERSRETFEKLIPELRTEMVMEKYDKFVEHMSGVKTKLKSIFRK